MLASCELLTGLSSSYFCEISEEEISLVEGQSHLLSATVRSSEEDATDFDRTVVWSSSNKEVAQVDENGKVTALVPGKATISAKPKVGGKAATCAVTVTKQPTYAWVRTKIVDWPGKSEESWVQSCKVTRTVTTEKKVDKDNPDKITIGFTSHRDVCGTPKETLKGSATNVLPKSIQENQRLDFTFYVYLKNGRGSENKGEAVFDVPDLDPHYATAGRVRFKDAKGNAHVGVAFTDFAEGTFTVTLEKMFKGKKEGDVISLYWRLAEYQLEAQYKWTQVD